MVRVRNWEPVVVDGTGGSVGYSSGEVRELVANALAKNRFFVHYQAQFDLDTGQVAAAEAFLRLLSDDGHVLKAGEFIPQTDMVGPITQWVVDSVCELMSHWYSDEEVPFRIAINVSSEVLASREFTLILLDSIRRHGVDLQCLEIELTPTGPIEAFGPLEQQIQELSAQGLRFALDGFGAGYSTIEYLTRLPVRTVKLHRSLVESVASSARSEHVVRTLIQLAHDLGVEAVASGVESHNQVDLLKELGCDRAQGYAFHYPSGPDPILALLRGDKESYMGQYLARSPNGLAPKA